MRESLTITDDDWTPDDSCDLCKGSRDGELVVYIGRQDKEGEWAEAPKVMDVCTSCYLRYGSVGSA